MKHGDKIPKVTWMSLNFKCACTWKTPSFNASYKKEKLKDHMHISSFLPT